jgi:hypothetical protein
LLLFVSVLDMDSNMAMRFVFTTPRAKIAYHSYRHFQGTMAAQAALDKAVYGFDDTLNDLFCPTDFDSSAFLPQQDFNDFGTWPPTPPRSVRTGYVAPVAVRAPEFTYSLPGTYNNVSAWSNLAPSVFDNANNDLVLSQTFQPSNDTMTTFMDPMKLGNMAHNDASSDLEALLKQMDENSDAVPLMDMDHAAASFDFSTSSPGTSRRLSSASLLSSVETYTDFHVSADFDATCDSSTFVDTASFNTCGPLITPDVSPKQVKATGAVRTMSGPRSGQSPTTRRYAPYTLDNARSQRAAMSSYAQTMNFAFPSVETVNSSMPMFPSQQNLVHNNLIGNGQNMNSFAGVRPTLANHVSQTSTFIPSSLMNIYQQFKPKTSLMSQGHVGVLQSSAEMHSYHAAHYLDSDPPDLYASLREDQSSPPPEDMNPSDPDMIPHEQELRFEGDLYTPRWVRGHGNKREGWCGLCKPGRWLVLKNSAFWYDKSFSHGVSAATGAAFNAPDESRRMDGNPDVWEGLCGSCHDYVPLVSSKKKGTTWFRHAYKVSTFTIVLDFLTVYSVTHMQRSRTRTSGGARALMDVMSSQSLNHQPHQRSKRFLMKTIMMFRRLIKLLSCIHRTGVIWRFWAWGIPGKGEVQHLMEFWQITMLSRSIVLCIYF